MDDIDHWLRARESVFFSRLGAQFFDDFSDAGLDCDDWRNWFPASGPEEVILAVHQRSFVNLVDDLASALQERVRRKSPAMADAEQAICRQELGACVRVLERCVPRLEAAGLVKNWAAWNAKLARISANLIVLSRLEERTGVPDTDRVFRWLGWTVERGHVVCGAQIIDGRLANWTIW